jgi:RHS repeat-associated protein
MTDQAASLVWDKVQWPFGETFSVSGASTNPKRFPGQLHDPETGFHYNYFRDYDPTTGRYLQSDPIGLDGGLNTYAYVGGNPVRFTDPTGKVPPDPYLICKIVPLICNSPDKGGSGGGQSSGEPPANDNECDVDCEEWFLALVSQHILIDEMKARGADTVFLERQYEQSAALFCVHCPEYCPRLPRF